jgi:uncharacterized protein DUF5677
MALPGSSWLRHLCGRFGSPRAEVVDPPSDSITLRATALVELVEGRLPVEGDGTGPETAWPMVGAALLSHATSSLRSIVFRLRPDGAHNDGSRLLRSLYDHVLTLAWLAADPYPRLRLWRKDDLKKRLTMARELEEVGEELFSAEDREQMERDIDAIEGSAPNLAVKAQQADEYWSPRTAEIESGTARSFRGLYSALFRDHSGLVHATFRGLNHVSIDLAPPRKRVVLEAPLEGNGPYGMATVVYGLGLLIAAQSLDWPDAEEVERIFARYP